MINTPATLLSMAEQYEPPLRAAFLQAVQSRLSDIDWDAVQDALAAHDIARATTLVLGTNAAIFPEVVAAAKVALLSIATAITGHLPTAMTFDLANPRAIALARTMSATLVREIDTATRQGIRQFITWQLDKGKNPRAMIPQLKGIVGLTERQAMAVANYRNALEAGTSDALGRALRDKRFDATVRQAIQGTKPLSPQQIDVLVNRYESRYRAYRAETIARTESIRALTQGQRLAWDAAIDAGKFQEDDLDKRWVTAHDDRVRPAHAIMDGVVVGYTEDFALLDPDSGKPTGESVWGPPIDVNCRCIPWIGLAA